MATLEQLAEGIRRAHAAGNAEHVKILGAEYRRLQAMEAQGDQDGQVPAINMSVSDRLAQINANRPAPDLATSSLATVGGLTASVPFLNEASDALLAGGQTVGDMLTGQPVDFGQRYGDIRNRRQQIAEAAPIAHAAGEIGGTVMGASALGATKAGAEALGMSGPWLMQLRNAILSSAGYEGLQGLAEGKQGAELLGDMGVGAASGGIGWGIGKAIGKVGQTAADKLTARAQNKVTNAAIKNAPSADDLFSAGSQLFDAATGGTPLQVTDNAYFRMLGDIQQATKKYRPNELNNPEAVGLLRQLWQVGDELSAGTGVAVDMKDLHILRQSASSVTQKPGASDQTKTIARLVVDSIDDFISGLKPADIAGSADPTAAANALLTGISTWNKASKVAMIEDAIRAADTYKSGTEMGLKSAFTRLTKSQDFGRFSKVEQDAIRAVAKGTTAQNALALLGRAGFSLGGGGGHNVIGGTFGAMTGTAALAPFLGPLAPIASLGLSMGGASAGRAGADALAMKAANRAAKAVAVGNIPKVRPLPNLLNNARLPADILIRGGVPMAGGARTDGR
jgi:hypothetical protein